MTTTAENHTDTAGTDEDTVVVPRPTAPQPPHGYAPYGAPGFGQPYGQQPYGASYGQQPYSPLSAGFAAGFPAPAKRRGLAAVSRTTWIAVAAAVTLIVAMVAVVVVGSGSGGEAAQTVSADGTSTTTTASTDAAPAKDAGAVLTAAELPALLLTPADLADLLGQPLDSLLVKRSKDRTTPYRDALIAGTQCAPLAFSAHQSAYQGSGFTAMRAAFTRLAGRGNPEQELVVDQGAFAYPSEDAAQDAMVATTGRWASCEGQSWGTRDGAAGADIFWSGGAVEVSDDAVVTALVTQENGNGWACWRGMSVVGSVVNDFAVCGHTPPAELAAAAAAAIAAKIPTA